MKQSYLLDILSILLITSLCLGQVYGEFDNQPKIQTENGNLILEAVHDKNITIRLIRDSILLVNDTNVLDVLRAKSTSNKLDTHKETLSIARLTTDIQLLRIQTKIVIRRLGKLKNRTLNNENFRRLNGRFALLLRSITKLENDINTNACAVHDCKNGGTCYNAFKDFYCDCMPGWEGKTCENDVDECYQLTGTELGCQNNGVCINTPGSYRCACSKEFVGTHCRLQNPVCENSQATELCGHGTCVHANNAQGFSCICDQGWTNNNTTVACVIDVNECDDKVNPCHTECINLPGNFKCGPCPSGYTGNGRQCIDLNECATNNGGCSLKPRVKCINTEGSHHCGSCPAGWVGDGRNCEKAVDRSSCNNENICHPDAKCEFISEKIVCTCPLGMFGHGFGEHGCNRTQTTGHVCDNHTCQNDGICIAMKSGGTTCLCKAGYRGATCELPDACQNGPCQNGGTCQLLPANDYRCNCMRGTTGKNCEIIRDICSTIIRQSSGEISYPSTGSNYESNERCAWLISTDSSKILNITFTAFDVEDWPDCNKDWLQIHDGSSLASQLIGRFCGKSLPLGGNIVSSHRQLFFWFRSDNATNGAGLKFSWTSEEHVCGGSMLLNENQNGIIRSPGYPGKAPNKRECEWELNAPFGQRILFRFYEVTLGGNENCTRDSLKIFDSGLLLKSICTTSVPEPVYSSTNRVRIHFHTDEYQVDSAFQLHYEVLPGAPHCGGLYTHPVGVISGFMNAPICPYLIKQPIGLKIRLTFTDFDLLDTNNCTFQRVEVYDGESDEEPLLKRLCGRREEIEPIISSGNALFLRYEYFLPSFRLPKKFEAKYERVCEESFFGPDAGIITTPNYPNGYLELLTCTYNIYGPMDSVVNISITDFSMVASVPQMNDDDDSDELWSNRTIDEHTNFLDVYLNKARKRRYYKAAAPMHFLSESNRLTVVFNGMHNGRKARGLRMEYEFVLVKCGGVLIADEGSFTKVGHTIEDPLYCEWVIEAPESHHISLKLDYSISCGFGPKALWIYSNSTTGDSELLDNFCGTDTANKVFQTNILTIIARVPLGRIFYRIAANYTLVNTDNVCGGEFSSRYGVIKSPGWPKPYTTSWDCVWIISAPIGHKIELEVGNFSLETTSGYACHDDYLEIRNGKYADSPLIGKYCGTRIPKRLPSMANHLYVRFSADDYIGDTGFFINWEQTETGCGGKLTSHKGSIHSPRIDNNGAIDNPLLICDWQIVVSKGSSINLKIQTNSNYCISDSLRIYDGATLTSPLLIFNCSEATDNINLSSTGNEVLVSFSIKPEDNAQFVLDYESNCNRQLNELIGFIESPNFPDYYPANIECVWDMRAGRNNKISIAFSHLEVEVTTLDTCSYDYVELIDMENDEVLAKKRYCRVQPEPFTTQGNRLQLKFVSDYAGVARGFHAEYKRKGCGEHLTRSFGAIESPKAPYSVDVDCDWYIKVAPGQQIVLQISELHIETDTADCDQNVFVVSDENKVLLKECQVELMPITVTSPGNTMAVTFKTSDTRARKYFKGSYATKKAKCGGTFINRNGMIASPNYPDKVSSAVECKWRVIVEKSYGFQLKYLAFNVPCHNASVELRIVDNNAEVPIFHACGDKAPNNELIMSNEILILYKSLSNNGGKFAIGYEKACGGQKLDPTGYLRSHITETCIWSFSVTKGAEISLNIQHLECRCANQTTCTAGLRFYNDDSNELLLTVCNDHQSNLIMPLSNIRLVASMVNFRAKYSNIQNSCGGVLTSLSGILASLNYPDLYPENVECIWQIEAKRGNYLELHFEDVNIIKSAHCNDDFLEIRQNNERGKLVELYCDSNLPADALTIFEKVWIKFRSAVGSSGGKFKLRWNYAFLNELNATAGVIESPPLLSMQQQDTAYAWRLVAERGKQIILKFKEYNKGLNLYDGYDDVALAIVIPFSPWQFISSSSVLYITTDNMELDNFKIDWEIVSSDSVAANAIISTCNEIISLPTNAKVELSSPGYPNSYANNLNCEWVVKPANPALHAVINLYEAKLEQSYDCTADSLSIFISSNLLDWQEKLKICQSGNKTLKPINIIHGTPYLKIVFSSDPTINGVGFTSVLKTGCGANMTSSVGTITNSELQQSIIINNTCLWHITVSAGRRIEINIEYPQNESASKEQECQDYALIYDGSNEDAELVAPGRICNQAQRNIKTARSTTNHFVIKYHISWHQQQAMNLWNLTYREYNDCGGEVRLTHDSPTVNISSPRFPNVPHPHTDCSWVIIAPVGETIRADFVDRFDMNMRYCNAEFVELFDGGTDVAPKLGQYCRRPDTIRTTSNLLYLHYRTDIDEPRNGFRVNVSIGICGGTFTGILGDIKSPNYRTLSPYKRPISCDYLIKLPTRSNIRLNFTAISLPYDKEHPETCDSIEVVMLDGNNTQIAKLYGNSSELPVLEIFSNRVLLRFRSLMNKNSSFEGFSVRYSRLSGFCYRESTGESGLLSLKARKNLFVPTICRWKITVPKGQRVRLEFLNQDEHVASNNTIYLSIFNDHDGASEIASFGLTSNNLSNVFQSTDNYMLVLISLRQNPIVLSLDARYSSADSAPCPEEIADTPHGNINLANLRTYNSFYCRIPFTLIDSETITFKIEQLLVAMSQSSNLRFAPLWFKNNELFTQSYQYSTNFSNKLVSLSARRGSLNLLQNNNAQLLDFRASYRRHACGGMHRLENGFVISYPDIDELMYGTLECVWTLETKYRDSSYHLLGNFSFTDSCEREYIVIYVPKLRSLSEMIRLCRDTDTFNGTLLHKPFTQLLYHAESYKPKLSSFRFVAEKSLMCGSSTKVLTKDFNSLIVDSKTYKNNIDCSWEFSSARGMYLSVKFSGRFFIENSDNCTKDYLEIFSYKVGIWQQVARYCGRNVPDTLNITTNLIQILFHTDNATTGDGFSLNVNTHCNGKFNATTTTQYIQTPQFSILRAGQVKCEFLIVADDPTKTINVVYRNTFNTVLSKMPSTARCRFSSITAFKPNEDGVETEIGEFCENAEFRAKKQVRLSYSARIERNIVIEYRLNTCGGNITTPTVIHSLLEEEADTYVDEMNCVWHVTAPADHSIVLRFKYFEMEEHGKCSYDNVAIYEGAVATEEKQLKKLCGNLTADPPVVMVDSSQAVIAAISDRIVTGRGFEASIEFTHNCNERIALAIGNSLVTLSRHFNLNGSDALICLFSVTAPKDHRVLVKLKELQLNNGTCDISTADCAKCNNLEVFDSIAAKRSSMGKYCVKGHSDQQLISSYEDITFVLSARKLGAVSFELLLQMEESVCGGSTDFELHTNETMEVIIGLNSSGSPFYLPNVHCTWRISSPYEFEIEFETLQLQNKSMLTGKCLDYVLIEYYYKSNYFCGYGNGFRVRIPALTDALVTFHSDATIEDRGFHLNIAHHTSCNETYTNLNELIYHSERSETTSACIDVIRVPESYIISLYFSVLYFTGLQCSKSYLKVIDLNSNKTLMNRCETFLEVLSLHTTTNAVHVESIELSSLRMFYVAQNRSLPIGCGGHIRTAEGILTNPPYNDRNQSECRWDIEVPSPNKILLIFSSFNMGTSSNCPFDFVKIYEVQHDGTEQLTKNFCGQDVPPTIISQGSRIALISKKSPNFDGVGWSLHFSVNTDSDPNSWRRRWL